MQQPQQRPSWWVGTTRQDFSEEAARRFPEMSKSAIARGLDATQGLRETKGKPGHRSAIRLDS